MRRLSVCRCRRVCARRGAPERRAAARRSWRRLETHGGIGLPTATPWRHVGLEDGVATVLAKSPQLPVQNHAVSQTIIEATINIFGVGVLLSLSKDWTPAAAGTSTSWTPAISSTVEPCSGRRPDPRRSPGWNGPLLSFRIFLSLVPPLAKSVGHLHESFVNNAPVLRWVNSTPAFSLIFSSAITGLLATARKATQPRCARWWWRGTAGPEETPKAPSATASASSRKGLYGPSWSDRKPSPEG